MLSALLFIRKPEISLGTNAGTVAPAPAASIKPLNDQPMVDPSDVFDPPSEPAPLVLPLKP